MENPQAFPMYFHGADSLQQGMTLRDYFAAQALQGLVSFHGTPQSGGGAGYGSVSIGGPGRFYSHAQQAHDAYRYADAMLAARSQS
jgi:hypothetical protein